MKLFLYSLLVLVTQLPLFTGVALAQKSVQWGKGMDSTQLEQPETTTKCRVRFKESIVPASLATTSLVLMAVPGLKSSIQDRLNWNASEKTNLFDDELRYVPIGAVALLSLTGMGGKHKMLEKIALGGISYLLADAIVYRTKQVTQVARPNPAYGNTSFPSQHTSMAFVGATLLHREFGSDCPWISVLGYGVAAWVGYSRVARNRHYLPDVLMGSAIGMMATNVSYWGYESLASKWKNRLRLTPQFSSSGGEILLSCQF